MERYKAPAHSWLIVEKTTQMKVGDLVCYKTPIGLPSDSPLAIVSRVDEEKEIAYITWVQNNKTDPMPLKWIEVISPLRLEI